MPGGEYFTALSRNSSSALPTHTGSTKTGGSPAATRRLKSARRLGAFFCQIVTRASSSSLTDSARGVTDTRPASKRRDVDEQVDDPVHLQRLVADGRRELVDLAAIEVGPLTPASRRSRGSASAACAARG